MRAGEQSEARPQGEARRIKAYDPTAKGRQYSFSDDEDSPLLHLPAANTSFKPRRDILADATCCVFFCVPPNDSRHAQTVFAYVLCVLCVRASSGSGLSLLSLSLLFLSLLFQVGVRMTRLKDKVL